MDNKKFDRKIKAKFESFERPIPIGLWDSIEKELNTVEQDGALIKENRDSFSKSNSENNSKTIRSLKRIILTYGSIAAMLFIVFLFWTLNDTAVIQLKNNQNSPPLGLVVEAKKNHKQKQVPAQSESAKPVELTVIAKKTTREYLKTPVNAKYSSLKNIETPIMIEENNGEGFSDQGVVVGIAELDLALAPTLIEEDQDGTIQTIYEHRELTSLKTIEDIEEEQLPAYAEVKRPSNKKIGVSTVLNFLAKGFSSEDGNSIEFSEDEEGILQWDIKSALAKYPK